jgi:hypothetical protein
MQSGVRFSRSRERSGCLSITVDSCDVLRVRRAIVQSGVHPIAIVKAAPLAGGTRVRMLIALPAQHIGPVQEAIARECADAPPDRRV